MKKVLLLAICLVVSSLSVFSQKARTPYSSAIGLRAGLADEHIGLTYKHYNNGFISYEIMGLVDYNFNGGEVYGFLQYNGVLPDVPSSFRYVLGGGAHVGGWSSGLALGLDGMLGVEYTFTEIPVNLGFDWHPLLNLYDPTFKAVHMWPKKFGLSVRYAIK